MNSTPVIGRVLIIVVGTMFVALTESAPAEQMTVCAILKEYVAATPAGFSNITGAYDSSVQEHYTLHNLPGAAKCTILDPGESIAELTCEFYFASAADRTAAFKNIRAAVEQCFSTGLRIVGNAQPMMIISGPPSAEINLSYKGEYDGVLSIKHY